MSSQLTAHTSSSEEEQADGLQTAAALLVSLPPAPSVPGGDTEESKEDRDWSDEIEHGEEDDDIFNDLLEAVDDIDIAHVQFCLDQLSPTKRRRVVNATDPDSFTLLMNAATFGDPKAVEMVRILLAAKSDVNYTADDGSTALDCCVQDNLHATVELLLAQPDIDVNSGRCSTIFLASQNGHSETVKKLLAAKARVDRRSYNGVTPLLTAIMNKFPDVVELLLQGKAQPNFPNASLKGFTPLIVAIDKKNLTAAKLLLKYKADPEQKVTILTGVGSHKMMRVEYPVLFAAR